MFILSLFLVLFSSYMFLSVINNKYKDKNFSGFGYFLLLSFCQIIITFEILSLLKMISVKGVLVSNIIFFIISIVIFFINGSKLYIPDLKEENNKIKFALKTDKILKILFCFYILFLVFQFISSAFFPITFGDSLTYYLPRCTSWIQNGSINHYITADSRELIMPVNMEFLYTWLLLFRKSEMGCALFAYAGYIGLVYVVYMFLKELNFSVRRRLWCIFLFSSFALISIEMYTPSADMFIGALIINSIYLFYKSLKTENRQDLFFSALSYALAVGVKTTALIAIPSVFVVMVIITLLLKKNNFFKYIFIFGGFFILNFCIFSSYNYILNYIQYSNPVSCSEQLLLNQFRGGFQGWLTNLIKYVFVIFDTSGIPDFINLNRFVEYIQDNVFAFLGLKPSNYASLYFPSKFVFDSQVGFMRSVLGILGLLTFLPSVIKSLKKVISKNRTKREIVLFALSLSLILNLLIFSRVMVFTSFNIRYILTFIIISIPVLVYSYIKKTTKFKILLCILMFIYLVGIPHKMPVAYVLSFTKYIKTHNYSVPFLLAQSDEVDIYNYMRNKNAKNVALAYDQVKNPVFYIEKIRLKGIRADKILLENIEEYKLNQYEYIITKKEHSTSTNIVNFEYRIKYPDVFVGKCVYYDYEQNTIDNLYIKPAMSDCDVPFEYFAHKGFYPVEDINLNDYVILKNTNN